MHQIIRWMITATLFSGLFFSGYRLFTQSAAPPVASTGAPGEGTCADANCHGSQAVSDPAIFEMKMHPANPIPEPPISSAWQWVPGTNYRFLYKIAQLFNQNHGFQLTILDTAGNSQGTFQYIDSSKVIIQMGGSRDYVGHRTVSAQNTWLFRWEAPSVYKGPLTIYTCGVRGDMDGAANLVDQVFCTTLTILPDLSGQPPVVTANAGPDMTICQGDTVQLFGSGGTTYTWSPAGSLSNGNISNPFAFPTVTTSYILTVSDGISSDSDTMTIFVHPLPAQPIISQTGTTLSSSATAGNTWFLDGLPWPGGSGQSISTTLTGIYTVVVTDQNGCSNTSEPFNYTFIGMENLSENDAPVLFIANNRLHFIAGNEEPGIIQIAGFDLAGKSFYSNALYHSGGKGNYTLEIPSRPAGSISVFQFKTDKLSFSKKLVH